MKRHLKMFSAQYGGPAAIGKLFALILFTCLGAWFAVTGARAQGLTIAALGDSLTQGYGLRQGDGLVPQLRARLKKDGVAVTLVNAGVSGDTTAGGLARIGWTLTPEVDALIVELGGNDVLRGIDPAVSRRNLSGILKVAKNRGLPVLLIGLEAPVNYGPDYKAAFDGMFPELATTYDTLLFPSFLAPLHVGRSDTEVLNDLLQSDGLHPNAKGVAIIVEALMPQIMHLIERTPPGQG